MINRNRPLAHSYNQTISQRLRETFINPLRKKPSLLVWYIWFFCMFSGSVLAIFVGINTDQFWKFLTNVTPAEIDRIEVQRIDKNGIGISDPITITDKLLIANFASAIKTVQEDSIGKRIPLQNETKVTVWLKNHHTVEFECYTIQAHEKTVFLGYVWMKPNIYGFGNGNAHFPESEFYNWLLSSGVDIE